MALETKEVIALSADQLHQLICQKKLRLTEVADLYLSRLEQIHPTNMFIAAEDVRQEAKGLEERLEKGEKAPPLLGVPIVTTNDLRLKGYGSALHKGSDCKAAKASPDELHLKKMGALVLGRLEISNFNLLVDNDTTSKSWELTALTGEGYTTLGIGSDLWGVLRISSGERDIFSLKMSRASLAKDLKGTLSYSQKYFMQRGITGRSLQDIAMLLNAFSDNQSPKLDPGKKLRIAWSPDLGFLQGDPEEIKQSRAALSALEKQGHSVDEVKLKWSSDLLLHCQNIVAADMYAPIIWAKGDEMRHFKSNCPSVRQWLAAGNNVTGVQYSIAISYVSWLRKQVNQLFDHHDALILPTSLQVNSGSPLAERCFGLVKDWAATLPFNMTGHPAVTIPKSGLLKGHSKGLQLIGRPQEEHLLLDIATMITDQ